MADAIHMPHSHVKVHEHSPTFEAFWILRLGFAVLPIVAGLDKFSTMLVDWTKYLAPWAANMIGAYTFMYAVGVIEIIAGIGVAIKPRIFAYVVAAWLVCIILNLLSIPGYYDVALRDLGLAVGALALGRLSLAYDTPVREMFHLRRHPRA